MTNEQGQRATEKDVYTWDREQCIAWLSWNDPNGIYSDEELTAEGCTPLTYIQAQDIAISQIQEDEEAWGGIMQAQSVQLEVVEKAIEDVRIEVLQTLCTDHDHAMLIWLFKNKIFEKLGIKTTDLPPTRPNVIRQIKFDEDDL